MHALSKDNDGKAKAENRIDVSYVRTRWAIYDKRYRHTDKNCMEYAIFCD